MSHKSAPKIIHRNKERENYQNNVKSVKLEVFSKTTKTSILLILLILL